MAIPWWFWLPRCEVCGRLAIHDVQDLREIDPVRINYFCYVALRCSGEIHHFCDAHRREPITARLPDDVVLRIINSKPPEAPRG